MKRSIDLPEEELEQADAFFEKLGTTTDLAIEWFIETTIREQRTVSIPKKKNRGDKPIKLTSDENGMLRLAEDAPQEAKDWIEHG